VAIVMLTTPTLINQRPSRQQCRDVLRSELKGKL